MTKVTDPAKTGLKFGHCIFLTSLKIVRQFHNSHSTIRIRADAMHARFHLLSLAPVMDYYHIGIHPGAFHSLALATRMVFPSSNP